MKGSHKESHVVAIVPAAGLGKRFGPGKNKPFQPLCGKPLVIWPLEVLQAVPEIVEIIPVLKIEDMVQGRRIFEEYNLSKIKRIAAGGKERQDSVHNALKLIDDDNCIVLIHDGVRPLIEKGLIENAVRELKISTSSHLIGTGKEGFNGINGIILGVPVKDTIKQAEEGIIKKTLKRDALWVIQTPQVFSYKEVMAAYNQAAKEKFYSTDDSALVEHYGGKIKVVLGSYRNIKVTTPEDLNIAETLLRINSNL